MNRRVSVTMDEELARILEKCASYDGTNLGSVLRGAALTWARRNHVKKGHLTPEECRYLSGG